MAKTFNSIADRVNQLLQNDYKDEDKLGAYVSGAATCQTLTIGDGRKYEKGDKLEINTEVMYILEAPKEIDFLDETGTVAASVTAVHVKTSGNFAAGCYMKINGEDLLIDKVSAIGSDNLKVTRGTRGTTAVELDKTAPIYYYPNLFVRRAYNGSTAAYHTNASVVYIVDGWSKFEIIENIKREMESLYPTVSRDFIGSWVGDDNRKTIDDCDTAANWTEGDDAGAAALNTSDEQEGTGCLDLSMTHSAGSGTYEAAPTSFDMTDYDYLNLWFYLEDKFDSDDDPYVDNNALEIAIGNDSSNYLSIKVGRDELNTGKWTLLNLPIAEFSATGTVDKAAIDWVRITVNAPQSITAGDIKMDEWFLTTYPVTTNKLKYRLPTGVRQVDEIRVLEDEDSNGFKYLRSYQIDEQYLYLADEYPYVNKPIIIKGQKAFTIPSDNTTTLDIEDNLEDLIIHGAAIKCISQKLMEILRSDKLSARYQEHYPLYLDREKRRLTDKYNELKHSLAKSMSVMADWKDYG